MTQDNLRNEIDPYDLKELQKYFDPYVFNSLSELTFSEIQWTRLAIAFWDISGFSDLCNKLTDKPVHFVSFLKEYSDEGSRIINGRKGILDKYIGDGIMAYFGYQGKYAASGPNEALLAALEFRDKFREIKDRYESLWLSDLGKRTDINLKCGMHVGYVFFGLFETERRKQITVLGPNANLASRLEHDVAVKDEIIVSEELKNMAKDNFSFEPKPVEKPLKAFEDIKTVFKLTGIERFQETTPIADVIRYFNGTCPKCMNSTRPIGLILPKCSACGFSVT